MGTQADDFVKRLASVHRVVVIGGLAVIAHGRNRSTKDADIWLEPFTSAEEWSENVILFCEQFQDLTLHGLPGWKLLNRQSIAEFVEQTGMIRINGLNYPLDIFRRPNEFEADDFDAVCKRATRTEDYTLQSLQEMADEGDPFSQAILKNRPIPYSHFPQAP